MPNFDAQAAKAAGYSDAEIQDFLKNQAPAALASNIGGRFDPSAGGGNFQVGPWDTGLKTPQWLDRTLSGTGRGMEHTAKSVGNLFGLVPNASMQNEKQTDAPLMDTTAGKIGNTIGEAAITAPLGMGAMGGLAKLGSTGASLAGNGIANMGIQGAVQGLATADPGERASNTLLGGATGAAFGGLGGMAGKFARGFNKSPAAQTLLNEGISLTPGQLNPGGAMNQFEQALEGVPGAKQIVHGARENAEQQFQAAVIQKAAAPGAAITPSENIHKMLQDAFDSYEPLYAQAKGFPIKPVIMNQGADVPLSDAFASATRQPGAPNSIKRSASDWLTDRLTKLGNTPKSDDLIALRSEIRARARQMNLSNDIGKSDAAAIYEKAANSVTNSLRSQLPQDALGALDKADSNYGVYKIVENAVAKSKDNIAGLTPQKLSQSIYEAISDPQYARGAGGNLRDLAQAGTSVFQTVVPPNGARVATLGAGLGAAMTMPKVALPIGAGMLGLTGTQTGRRFAAGMTAPQRAMQGLMGKTDQALPDYSKAIIQQLLKGGGVSAGLPMAQQAFPAALSSALMMAPKAQPQ